MNYDKSLGVMWTLLTPNILIGVYYDEIGVCAQLVYFYMY